MPPGQRLANGGSQKSQRTVTVLQSPVRDLGRWIDEVEAMRRTGVSVNLGSLRFQVAQMAGHVFSTKLARNRDVQNR